MAFLAGKSGNPNGRPKGALNKRTQLANLLEPHAEALIAKAIELALSGDTNALRLCIERLIPKINNTSTNINLPIKITKGSLPEAKEKILSAVFDGEIDINHAEKLINLIDRCYISADPLKISNIDFSKLDAIEAAKAYQQMMRGI
ncbi:MAG: DUF5681 domain-containing protein [Gammaproteobacteria bacterium]